ncbi:major facilitator superfamily domain-containing protein [Parachaetomium inaequale]|uniref:Major facilitator superfamily domain-containing protein n=1 Tax=Parachaetomium inaequale TaxID=2588326 RepID=A0AAN6PFF0_9PEZI|nr:major facilitator superfamily domain-containing protein [Parachaetomium inaequale]
MATTPSQAPEALPVEPSEKPSEKSAAPKSESTERTVVDPTDSSTDSPATASEEDDGKTHYGWRFWAVFAGLVAATLLSALDGSIVATALPTIARELNAGPSYVWIANVYFLTGAVFQPLFAQLSDLYGRRWVFLGILAVFILGSGLCGGASSAEMLIGARAVQGIGAGGINMMVDLIVCDLVPVRDRSKFLGMIFGCIGIFTAVAPLIGGALAQSGQWRWAFYLNLPIGAACMVITFLFLRVHHGDHASLSSKMKRIDWGGITLLTLSCLGVMYAVTYGGASRPWSDPRVYGPLTAGLLLIPVFILYEGSPLAIEPVTPYHLFANRTSSAAFAITFLHSIMCLWVVYVFAVYFQAVLGVSQTLSGAYLIPTVVAFPLSAAIGGGVMAKIGRYKPIHLASFALLTLGCGLASLLGPNSNPAMWVFFQIFLAVGIGLPMATLLPAVQARLPERDAALSTGTWAFLRSVGVIWAVTIPAAVFNNRFESLLYTIDDAEARGILDGGQAYAQATAEFVSGFAEVVRDQVREVYSLSVQRVWHIAIVLSGVSFLLVLLEKEVELRKELNTEFGLQKEEGEGKKVEPEP